MTQEITADAIAALYVKHRRGFLYHAWRVLRDVSAAEDAVQEAMIRACRLCGQYSGASTPYRWLVGVVFNMALHHRRSLLVRRGEPLGLHAERADEAPVQDRLVDSKRLAARIEVAMLGLGEVDQAIVRMRFSEGMELPEITERLGLRYAYVRHRAWMATRRLRVKMGGSCE